MDSQKGPDTVGKPPNGHAKPFRVDEKPFHVDEKSLRDHVKALFVIARSTCSQTRSLFAITRKPFAIARSPLVDEKPPCDHVKAFDDHEMPVFAITAPLCDDAKVRRDRVKALSVNGKGLPKNPKTPSFHGERPDGFGGIGCQVVLEGPKVRQSRVAFSLAPLASVVSSTGTGEKPAAFSER